MIGSVTELMQTIRRSVQNLTPAEKISVREELNRRLGGHMPFMPISSEDWRCSCGNRRKMFFNPERLRALRCPSCDLADILSWLRLPAASIIRELDQEFLLTCRIRDPQIHDLDLMFSESDLRLPHEMRISL